MKSLNFTSRSVVQVERRFVAAVVKDDTGERLSECRALPPNAFSDDDCARAWHVLVSTASYEESALHPAVRGFFAHPCCGMEYAKDRDEVYFNWLRQIGMAGIGVWSASLPKTNKDKLRARIQARSFNFATPPKEAAPRFSINGRAICTCGNLTNLIAQAKAGKSALTGAMLAAAICSESDASGCDTLGVSATPPRGLKLLHIDTEQSPCDHDQHVRRALQRAGVREPPRWLASFGLAGFSADDLRQVLRLTLEDAHASGGVFAAIIDGTADLVNDVNDASECNAFVAELHDLAIRYSCPIVNVVHENPGQDGGKMRGHLGSQLERKAESNLRLKKSDEVTVVFSEKMRRAPILERDGPRFQWDDGVGMHMSMGSKGALRESEALSDLRDLAEEVFATGRLRYAEACLGIEKARRVGAKAGEKWFTKMKKASVIRNAGLGMWEKAPV